MKIHSEQIGNGINLTTIPSKQYKTNLISIYFKRPLKKEEVTKNSLIPYVLRAGSKNHKTQSIMVKELQKLYGSSIGVGVNKVGERQIINFKLAFTNEKYLEEKIAGKAIGLLLEMIFEPYLEDGIFKQSYVDIEKEILEEAIASKINNKTIYAVEKMIDIMCEGEPYSIPEEGYKEDLKNIDAKTLHDHYKEIIRSSEIDIVLSGDVDKNLVQKLFEQKNIQRNQELVLVHRESIYAVPEKVKTARESMNVTQGKLVMGFRTNIAVEDALSLPLTVYSVILGSGVSSKLFANVREKHSLCYSIGASLEKMKSLMFIHAGIDAQNYELAKEKILEQFHEMEKGNITEEELYNAKKYIINSIKSVKDSIWSVSDYIYGLKIQGSKDTPEQVIDKIEKITKDEVIEASKNIKLDTIYFLTNDESEAKWN